SPPVLGTTPGAPCCVFGVDGDRGGLGSFPTRRSSDLVQVDDVDPAAASATTAAAAGLASGARATVAAVTTVRADRSCRGAVTNEDRKSTRLNSSHVKSSYAVFCLNKKIAD